MYKLSLLIQIKCSCTHANLVTAWKFHKNSLRFHSPLSDTKLTVNSAVANDSVTTQSIHTNRFSQTISFVNTSHCSPLQTSTLTALNLTSNTQGLSMFSCLQHVFPYRIFYVLSPMQCKKNMKDFLNPSVHVSCTNIFIDNT